ncbi:MAG TPA: hypothetical protein VFV19_13565 [Candidatus Polarisedimenticolaceae bacterium]|nr:hypothetical protein [Candidatus Polarisedimenticolaceae bacterium]
MSRRTVIRSIVIAAAALVTAWAVSIDVRGPGRAATKPGLDCKPCTDPCVDVPKVTTACVDKETGRTFPASYTCCCCNDQWERRKLISSP